MLLLLTVVLSFEACKTTKKKQQSYLKKAFIELKDSFPEADVTILHDSVKVIFPDNIMFDFNSAVLLPSFQPKLQRFSNILIKYGNTNILTTGHTDNTGDAAFNIKLSQERAANVKENMVEKGVASTRILVWGLGMKSPLASNDTEKGRALNRRVEFVILFKPN